MLQRMGIETDKFASSTGTMRGFWTWLETAGPAVVKTIWASLVCSALVTAAPAQDEFLPADLLQEADKWLGEQ